MTTGISFKKAAELAVLPQEVVDKLPEVWPQDDGALGTIALALAEAGYAKGEQLIGAAERINKFRPRKETRERGWFGGRQYSRMPAKKLCREFVKNIDHPDSDLVEALESLPEEPLFVYGVGGEIDLERTIELLGTPWQDIEQVVRDLIVIKPLHDVLGKKKWTRSHPFNTMVQVTPKNRWFYVPEDIFLAVHDYCDHNPDKAPKLEELIWGECTKTPGNHIAPIIEAMKSDPRRREAAKERATWHPTKGDCGDPPAQARR